VSCLDTVWSSSYHADCQFLHFLNQSKARRYWHERRSIEAVWVNSDNAGAG
jgi:hypothetical protein